MHCSNPWPFTEKCFLGVPGMCWLILGMPQDHFSALLAIYTVIRGFVTSTAPLQNWTSSRMSRPDRSRRQRRLAWEREETCENWSQHLQPLCLGTSYERSCLVPIESLDVCSEQMWTVLIMCAPSRFYCSCLQDYSTCRLLYTDLPGHDSTGSWYCTDMDLLHLQQPRTWGSFATHARECGILEWIQLMDGSFAIQKRSTKGWLNLLGNPYQRFRDMMLSGWNKRKTFGKSFNMPKWMLNMALHCYSLSFLCILNTRTHANSYQIISNHPA